MMRQSLRESTDSTDLEITDDRQVVAGHTGDLEPAVVHAQRPQWTAVEDLVEPTGWSEAGESLDRPT